MFGIALRTLKTFWTCAFNSVACENIDSGT